MDNFLEKFSVFAKKDLDASKWTPNVRRDVARMFSAAIIASLCFIFFHLYTYFVISSEQYYVSSANFLAGKETRLNTKELKLVLELFQRKKTVSENITRTPVVVTDPSFEEMKPPPSPPPPEIPVDEPEEPAQ